MLNSEDLAAIKEIVCTAIISEHKEIVKDMEQIVCRNNIAIGEVLTQALEDHEKSKHSNNVYKLVPIEEKQG